MASKEIPDLDEEGLRKFAFTLATVVILLFALLIPWLLGRFPVWSWIVGGGLAVWGVVAPGSLKPVYELWMRFGLVMNRITTPIILGIVFFIVLTPIAFAMRLFGRDMLKLKSDRDADSYRVVSSTPDKTKLERPY